MKSFKQYVNESVPKPGEVHHIDWDGKSKVYVNKVVGKTVHLTRLNRPIVKGGQPVRDEDRIELHVDDFNKAKIK